VRVKLGEVFDLQMGKTPARNNPDYWNGDNAWVSISDLGNAEKYIDRTKEKITDKGVKESGIKIVPKGTVIMSFKLSIGKTAITAGDMYTNEAIMAFLDKKVCEMDTDYLYHLFSGFDWSAGTNKAVMGLTLNKATLSKKEIPLPPITEQRKIAAVLDKVCELISLRHKQLERLDLMVKARFVEMFGDQYTNKKDWLIVNLEELFSISSSKRIYQDEQSRTGIPFFRISDLIQKISTGKNTAEIFIPMEKYEELKRLDLVPKSGDILITSRGTLGKCYVVSDEDKFYFQDGMISWLYNRDKRITVTYIVCLFEMPWFRKQIDDIPTGTTVNYLSIERLKKLKIMLPDIKTQKNFSDFVTEIDKLKLPIQRSLDTLEVLKKSLMQEYFGQGV
jgi:type I restriction enzyme S subunit